MIANTLNTYQMNLDLNLKDYSDIVDLTKPFLPLVVDYVPEIFNDKGKQQETTMIATDFKMCDQPESSNEEFLNFLDNKFKPEIELGKEEVYDFSFEQEERNQREEEIKEVEPLKTVNLAPVNQKYKGYKGYKANREMAGVFGLRKDVKYKNLMRSMRRYLWGMFASQFDVKSIGKRKTSPVFEEYVSEFYDRNFKPNSLTAQGLLEDEEKLVKFYLGAILTKKYYFKNCEYRETKARETFEKLLTGYSPKLCHNFFTIQPVTSLLRILQENQMDSDLISTSKFPSQNPSEYKKSYNNLLSKSPSSF